jgi:hypothetical protein
MRITLLSLFLLLYTQSYAQKPCEYSINIKDSLGTLKETKSYLVYEKVFGNKAQLIFLKLISDNATPLLGVEVIQKSTEFIAPKCLNKDSKVYFQLSNGKIYTLIIASEEACDNLIYNNEEKQNNRFLSAKFYFRKDDYEAIKKYPIITMRINYAGETEDYILPKQLISEKIEGFFEPDDFFINNFYCLDLP